MNIKIKGNDYKVEFTFNSFKYLDEFDISVIDEIQNKPFKIITVCEQLLFGALNNNPTKVVTLDIVDAHLEDVLENGDISELLNTLMELLQESNFFKNLQKKQVEK